MNYTVTYQKMMNYTVDCDEEPWKKLASQSQF